MAMPSPSICTNTPSQIGTRAAGSGASASSTTAFSPLFFFFFFDDDDEEEEAEEEEEEEEEEAAEGTTKVRAARCCGRTNGVRGSNGGGGGTDGRVAGRLVLWYGWCWKESTGMNAGAHKAARKPTARHMVAVTRAKPQQLPNKQGELVVRDPLELQKGVYGSVRSYLINHSFPLDLARNSSYS